MSVDTLCDATQSYTPWQGMQLTCLARPVLERQDTPLAACTAAEATSAWTEVDKENSTRVDKENNTRDTIAQQAWTRALTEGPHCTSNEGTAAELIYDTHLYRSRRETSCAALQRVDRVRVRLEHDAGACLHMQPLHAAQTHGV